MRIDEVSKIVCTTIDNFNINIDDNLNENGMDSISFVKIIVNIEDYFNIEFPDELLALSRINTIRDIYEAIKPIIED